MFDQRYGRGVPRLYWDGGDVGGVDEAGIGVSEDGSADAGTGTGSGSSGGSGGGSSGGSGGSAGGMYNVDPFFDPSIGQMYNVDPSIDIDPNIDPSIALMANTTPQNTVAAPVETTSPHYGDPVNVFGIEVRGLTDAGQAYQDEQDALQGMNWGDTQYSDGAAFPSMYDPAPPVVEQPVIDPITQPGPTTSPEDSILFHFTPQERHSYLLNQIEMGMEPTRGYTGPDGVFVDLTAIYPEIFYPDQVFRQPMVPMSGGGYVDDYRMNRGGIMDLREPHLYNRGGNVMRNIRDEQARVIGVQDDADDQMNRIRYHSGRDARDERFRVAARERDARAEMGRLRGEARYEDTHGRGPRAFNQGGVASLAPVARDMFRKRRLPRAGMVV